jgi:hypothetical protein
MDRNMDRIWMDMAPKMAARLGVLESDVFTALQEAWGNERVADTWHIVDVHDAWREKYEEDEGEDYAELTDEQAYTILQMALDNCDGENGMSWTQIDFAISDWIDKEFLNDSNNE